MALSCAQLETLLVFDVVEVSKTMLLHASHHIERSHLALEQTDKASRVETPVLLELEAHVNEYNLITLLYRAVWTTMGF